MIRASWDDGCASDVRMAELMERYHVPTVFYWPVEWHSLAHDKGYEPLLRGHAVAIAQRHEIGSHTITHRHLTDLPVEEAKYEIGASQLLLGEIFGQRVTKFCPPRGYTNADLTAYALEFYESQRLTKGAGLVHVHPNSGANDNQPWRVRLRDELAKGGDVEIWGHSWELDKYDLWSELEEALQEVCS